MSVSVENVAVAPEFLSEDLEAKRIATRDVEKAERAARKAERDARNLIRATAIKAKLAAAAALEAERIAIQEAERIAIQEAELAALEAKRIAAQETLEKAKLGTYLFVTTGNKLVKVLPEAKVVKRNSAAWFAEVQQGSNFIVIGMKAPSLVPKSTKDKWEASKNFPSEISVKYLVYVHAPSGMVYIGRKDKNFTDIYRFHIDHLHEACEYILELESAGAQCAGGGVVCREECSV